MAHFEKYSYKLILHGPQWWWKRCMSKLECYYKKNKNNIKSLHGCFFISCFHSGLTSLRRKFCLFSQPGWLISLRTTPRHVWMHAPVTPRLVLQSVLWFDIHSEALVALFKLSFLRKPLIIQDLHISGFATQGCLPEINDANTLTR